MSRRAKSGGFSLLETLVALAVLSMGLLGMAALHAQAVAVNRGAQLASHALDLAADMAERMRANRAGGQAYADTGVSGGCDGSGEDCAPDRMAQHDVFEWLQRVRSVLPNGAGQVGYDDAVVPPEYIVAVRWEDAGREQGLHELRLRVEVP